jgi:hypothetical protein
MNLRQERSAEGQELGTEAPLIKFEIEMLLINLSTVNKFLLTFNFLINFGMKVLSSTFIYLCLLFEEFHVRFELIHRFQNKSIIYQG